MGQEAVMLKSFLFVTACVFSIMIGIYLRALWEARKAKRTVPVDTDDLDNRQDVLHQMRRMLWGLAGVVGVTVLIYNDLFR